MNQIEILELKNAVTELQNSIQSFSSRLDQAEERICELEDRSFQINYSDEQEWKRMVRNTESLWASWDTTKTNTPYNSGVTEGEEREEGVENLFKEIMAKNFPNLTRDLDIQFMKLIGHLTISI